MNATGVGIELPSVPAPPLSMNECKGKHWKLIADLLDPWRDTTAWLAKPKRRQVHAFIAEHGFPVKVQVTIPFGVERRRDPHNYVGTVVKSVVDGLVIARWFPDDTAAYVTVLDPLLVVGGLPQVEVLPHG